MQVTDVPQYSPQSDYEQALARYARLARSRAIAVYQLGDLRFPGLSFVELLVVTDRTDVDNRYYYSPRSRLPQRYHALFVQEPYILPAWSIRVIQYTLHRRLQLIAGREVLQAYPPLDESDERWCRLLEAYCSYCTFIDRVRAKGILHGRMTLAAARAFCDVLDECAAVFPETANAQYRRSIDELCEIFFTQGTAERHVQSAWHLLTQALEELEAVLHRALDVGGRPQAIEYAKAVLCGDGACAFVDRDYAFRRSRDIAGYRAELASMGFPYGHLFFDPGPTRARVSPESSIVDTIVAGMYRLRRRLAEYAHA